MGKEKEWEGVTGGNTLGQKGLLLLFRLFNVPVIYGIMALVVPFYMLFSRKGYLAIYSYFRDSVGYSPLQSFYRTYRNHFVFGQCMLDRFAVYAGRRDYFELTAEGVEYFNHLTSQEKGFILASSHTGNFELGGYLLRQDKKPVNTIVYGGETKEIMKNREKILRKNNVSIIPVSEDMSHIFIISNALLNGEIVNMPCDRNLGSSKSVECDFLGRKADFPIGAFILAVKYDVPVLASFVMKKSASEYRIYIRPVSVNVPSGASDREKAAGYAVSFAKELEAIVREYPEQWFNYYDFWKK